MYQIADIFEPQHAQTTMEKSENGSSQVWKPLEEEDGAIIAKSFTPVWEFNPLFSITDEILKRHANGWSRGERMQLIEYVTSENKSDQDKKRRNENESKENLRIQRSEPQRERTKLLEYVASKDKLYQDQKIKERREALAAIQRRRQGLSKY